MSIQPVDLTGGKSVFCFNQSQLDAAFTLAESDTESGIRIRAKLEELEANMTRNEQAAIAFVITDRLNKTAQ